MKHHMGRDSTLRWVLTFVAISVASSAAHAHVGVSPTDGFLRGLEHPLTGFDHLAAMIAVGLWAAQRGGCAVWIMPLAFVTVMSLGGLLGTAGAFVPFVEPGIAASVFILGLLVAAAVRPPLLASTILVGLFALLHGHAHGTEMPASASALTYGIGFMMGTGALLGCGVAFGLSARKFACPDLIRYAGGATMALGLYLQSA
jgi:urease accessory protein